MGQQWVFTRPALRPEKELRIEVRPRWNIPVGEQPRRYVRHRLVRAQHPFAFVAIEEYPHRVEVRFWRDTEGAFYDRESQKTICHGYYRIYTAWFWHSDAYPPHIPIAILRDLSDAVRAGEGERYPRLPPL